MSENDRYRVNYMIRRASPTPSHSLQSKPPPKVGWSSHIRIVRVVIDSMSANFHRIRTSVDRSIKGSSKLPIEH